MTETAVLLPVYYRDTPEHLFLAIDSIHNQTYRDFDLIFCIDGELGNELAGIISSGEGQDRTLVISHKDNRGLAFTLNQAIEYVLQHSYRYIARMDSDDIMERNRLEIQVDYLNTHPAVDAVGSGTLLIDTTGNILGQRQVRHVVRYSDLLWRSPLVHAAMVFRKEFFEEVGLYDDGLSRSQDYDLWFRALQKKKIIHNIQAPLYSMRVSGDLIRRRKEEQSINIRIKKKYYRGVRLWLSILPNLMIYLLPAGIISYILRNSRSTNKSF